MGDLIRVLTHFILNKAILMNHFKNKDLFWFLFPKLPIYLIKNQDKWLDGTTESARRVLENIDYIYFCIFTFL